MKKSKKVKSTKPSKTKIVSDGHIALANPAIVPPFQNGFWKSNLWAALLLLILPFALYWQTLSFGYVLDDTIVITDNSFTKQGLEGIDDLFTTESFTGYFGEQKNLVQGNRYRPLSFVTFAIEYAINDGLNPAMSHFINILLYALLGLLLFRVLSYLFGEGHGKKWWWSLAFLISILYILHPIHSEAVANIKGRDEIMAMLLSIATLYLSLKQQVTGKLWILILASVVFFLALLSKENAITFLAVIPLTYYFFTNMSFWTSMKKVLPFLGVTVLYLVVRFSAAGVPELGQEITDLMNNPFVGMSAGERLATVTYTLLKYLQLYIFPHPLSHDYYPYAIPKLGWGSWQALVSLAVYVGLFVWAVRGWKSKSVSSYGLFFYFVTLSIASNVLINLGTFMNERFIFMASLGLTIWTTYLIREKLYNWMSPVGKYLAFALVGAMVIGYSFKTIDRVADWESALTLNKSAVEGGTSSARANSFMATAIYEDAKTKPNSTAKTEMLIEAYDYAIKAINIHPRYGNANLMLAGIAAELYKGHGDQTRLLADFKVVADRRPDTGYLTEYMDYLEGRSPDLDEVRKWYQDVGLGVLQSRSSPPQWAAHYLLRAYRIDKYNKAVLKGLADSYNILGDQANAQRFTNELNSL